MAAIADYRVIHETHYHYEGMVHVSQQLLHLTPRPCAYQKCEAHRIDVEPAPAQRYDRVDYFGNLIVQVALDTPHDHLAVHAESLVSVMPHAPTLDPEASIAWEEVRSCLQVPNSSEALEACQFAFESPFIKSSAALLDFAHASFTARRPVLAALLDLTRRIYDEFEFDPEATSVTTPVHEVLERRRGVCQDFAHLQIACLRALGLAARYVSGYILTTPPPGQPRLIGADASHAWVSLFMPGLGWIDADPTNNLLPDTQHIALAWGRDFSDVSPLRGVILGGGEHELEVRVSVLPLEEAAASAPRLTG